MPEERIQKVLANAGVASRRASDALVAAGRVTIDGRRATIGEKVDPTTAVIEVDGAPVGIGVARAYVALHKPIGVTSTTQDRHAAETVLDLVPTTLVPDGTRLYPVGRLDPVGHGMAESRRYVIRPPGHIPPSEAAADTPGYQVHTQGMIKEASEASSNITV